MVETLVHLHSLGKLTLSLFLSTNGTSYVSNGSNFWKKISDGNGWNIGSSTFTWENWNRKILIIFSYTSNIHVGYFTHLHLMESSKIPIYWIDHLQYCKFGNFRENFIFANGAKRRICHVKCSRRRHDLPISVNARVNLPFYKGFFRETSHMRSFAKIKPSQKFSNLQ